MSDPRPHWTESLPSPAIGSADAFLGAIDRSREAARSVVLRYRRAVALESDAGRDARLKELLERTSIREGVRITPLLSHRGVEVDVLDETSLMHTRTLKSIDGCLATAQCLLRGDRHVVFESGGNTGTALTAYCGRAGLETSLFVPAENVPLLDGSTFGRAGAAVIAVEEPQGVKPAAAAFAARNALPRIPEVAWRIQASTFVGCFLLEHLLGLPPYDVLAQSISAGFGPVGIYRVLAPFRERLHGLPSFLGVQQSSNCAMARALGGDTASEAAQPVASTAGLLARVMYDGDPATYGTVEPLREILADTGGRITTLDHEEFDRALRAPVAGRRLLEHLAARGIRITLSEGEVREKTGLMALAATVRDIEAGRIETGSRVLVCLTGGTAQAKGKVLASSWGDRPEAATAARRLA